MGVDHDHERWWNYRDDGVVFGFGGEKGRQVASDFWHQCVVRGDRCRPEGWKLPPTLT